MKKILIFSLNYYPRFIGGAEVAIKEITDRISPQEIEFHMVTLQFDSRLPRMERIGNVLIHRIGFGLTHPSVGDLRRFPLRLNKFWYQFSAFLMALRLHRRYRFDATWAMTAHSCAIPAGLFKLMRPEIPYLLTLQEGDPPEHIERMMRPFSPLFYQGFKKADELQAISTFLLEWGKRSGFHGKAEVIPNGVDTALFAQDYSQAEIEEMKEKLGKKEKEVFLVTTSRLVRKNAVDDVIRALAHLPPEISFLIYGIGPDEAKLRELAHELDVETRVRFMGQIKHADMPRMLRACDIFIRPSRSEGMGNSFVEAMAAGLPVIATQEGGLADFLFDAKRNPDKPSTGWAVDANAPDQIAEAVTAILANPSNTAGVVKTARVMVMEKYDWSLVAGSMRTLFLGLLDRGILSESSHTEHL